VPNEHRQKPPLFFGELDWRRKNRIEAGEHGFDWAEPIQVLCNAFGSRVVAACGLISVR
jgi:hypothetical protein